MVPWSTPHRSERSGWRPRWGASCPCRSPPPDSWSAASSTGRDWGRPGNLLWIVVAGCGIALSLYSTLESLAAGRLGVDVIALLALVGAVAVGEYLAGAVISVMLASGRALEGWAAGQARRELQALLERAPRTAHRYDDGGLTVVDLEQVSPGDLLLVPSGEVVPVDGSLVSPSAVLDESALTGEPLPVERVSGDRVRSGVVNAGAPVDLRATTSAADSTYAGIIRLVAEAERSQAPVVRLADRYALGFLAVTLATAAAAWAVGGATRAVAVLVVATPCPLILAAPVALVAGLSRAARRGVVVKGGAVLERLATCTTLLIDKTGTMTVGHPVLTEVVCAGPGPGRSDPPARSVARPGVSARPRQRRRPRRPRAGLRTRTARRRGGDRRSGHPRELSPAGSWPWARLRGAGSPEPRPGRDRHVARPNSTAP